MFLILGGFFLMFVSKFGEQIVKWRSWRLPGQGGVVVVSPQGFASSAHLPFRKHISPCICPAQRKSPRLPLRKAPPTPSLLSPHPHPNHLHTIPGRQNPTSPQTGKRPQPPTPKTINILWSYGLYTSSDSGPQPQTIDVVVMYGSPPPKTPQTKPNIYGFRGRLPAREIHMIISKAASYGTLKDRSVKNGRSIDTVIFSEINTTWSEHKVGISARLNKNKENGREHFVQSLCSPCAVLVLLIPPSIVDSVQFSLFLSVCSKIMWGQRRQKTHTQTQNMRNNKKRSPWDLENLPLWSRNHIVCKEFRLISGFPCLSKNLCSGTSKLQLRVFFCICAAFHWPEFEGASLVGADFLTEAYSLTKLGRCRSSGNGRNIGWVHFGWWNRIGEKYLSERLVVSKNFG